MKKFAGKLIPFSLALLLPQLSFAAAPFFPGVSNVVQAAIAAHDVAGAVTVVVAKDKIVHLEASGFADLAAKKPMQPDSLFWIASMTKPVTATAILLLQDEGKLNVNDSVAKYIPEFAALKTPAGQPANITLAQLLTHTSALGDISDADALQAHTLAELIPLYLAKPMQFEPGTKWKFCQSGMNTAARVVEIVSGIAYDSFVQQRILDPLGMTNTTFRRTGEFAARLVTAYSKNPTNSQLEAVPPRPDVGGADRPPFGNMGLYSTGPDYARFCQMLLGGGVLDGKRFLSAESIKLMTTLQTGDLPAGFFQSPGTGSHGTNYGWGLGTCILRTPHEGAAAMLSPGTFGHGGGWGTQAWIDPVRGAAYILMVQRSNFGNSDNTALRRTFQQAAVEAMEK
jgi:CubicO group peptidase (beta-lactamase class C family)